MKVLTKLEYLSQSLIDEGAYCLSRSIYLKPLMTFISFILQDERNKIKDDLKGNWCLAFDETTQAEALVLIVCYLDDWICQEAVF